MASISDLQTQLAELESTTDDARRNELALYLMDRKVPGLVEVLVRLIQRLELHNNRGTLVYCLSHFDCRRHFEFLVELVITGNYEVAHHAMDALWKIELSRVKANKVLAAIEQARARDDLHDHQREFIEHLWKWFE